MDSPSVDLSTYRFGPHREAGLARLDSFDFTSTTGLLTASLGTYYSELSPNLPQKGKRRSDDSVRNNPQVLTWRLDPDESLSDYTLTVVSNPHLGTVDEKSDEDSKDEILQEKDGLSSSPRRRERHYPSKKFFVHRTQLAVGPRRSEYFSKILKRKAKRDGKTGATRIELRPSAAAAFPAMLDFMYSPVGSPADVSTETAVALRHLATCFGIRELFDFVTEFIKRDLQPNTAPTYLLEGEAFRHERLSQVALETCAENFESIKFGKLVVLTPDLFLRVLTSESLSCSSEVLSSRVASYCRCRPGAVDLASLESMTNPQRMPRIAAEESLFFLHLIAEVQTTDDDDVSNEGSLRSLYTRCVESSSDIVRLAVANKGILNNLRKSTEPRPKRNAIKDYHSLPSNMKVDLVEHALSECPSPEDLAALETARRKTKKKQANISVKQQRQMESEIEKVRRKYEKKLASVEAQMEAQEEELRAYALELSKFVRVPNEHRVTPLISEYTFQQRPEYDEYGESIYGETPPSELPRFGNHLADGWIMTEERWRKDGRRDVRHWPMYVYKGE